MKKVASLVIVGILLLSSRGFAGAAGSSDWPSLNADAAQSNYNPAEKSISASNVLKLKVLWMASVPDVSYPVVAGGRVYVPMVAGKAVHARALDAATGKQVAVYTKGAVGGILAAGGNLFLAGPSLEELDPSSGDKTAEVKGSSTSGRATFTYPLADRKLILAGYSTESQSQPNSLYAIDAASGKVLWRLPSLNARGAAIRGRVMTMTASGSAFYNETNGRAMASQKAVYGDWFGGNVLSYTVAAMKGKVAALYAFDASGHKVWSRTVGPNIDTINWPHAVNPDGVFVATLKPHSGLEALDPLTGEVTWSRTLVGVQRLAVANGLVFALAAGLAQPLRLVIFQASSGKAVGAISLSGAYYAFPTNNELMVANGMVFIRAVGPGGVTQLVALGR